LNGSGFRIIQRLQGMNGFYMFAIGVVQKIKRLADHRIREEKLAAVLQLPLNRRIAHRADAVCPGQ
jgi:hypothetical protein